MAAANTTKGKKVVRKRRERKNVEKGQVHIRSSFNNTMVTVTDTNAMPCLGLPPVAWASAAPESPPPMQPRLRPRPQPRRPLRPVV